MFEDSKTEEEHLLKTQMKDILMLFVRLAELDPKDEANEPSIRDMFDTVASFLYLMHTCENQEVQINDILHEVASVPEDVYAEVLGAIKSKYNPSVGLKEVGSSINLLRFYMRILDEHLCIIGHKIDQLSD